MKEKNSSNLKDEIISKIMQEGTSILANQIKNS